MAVFCSSVIKRALVPKLTRKLGECHLYTCASTCAAAPPDDVRYSWLSTAGGGAVDLTKDDASGLAVLTLNNPERLNAVTGHMMLQLGDIVNDLKEWKNGKALIVRGKGRSFCPGADLNMVYNMLDSKQGREMCSFMHRTLTELHRLPLISVAAIDGPAIGGGAELCTATDFRVMTERADIKFVQALLGIVPGWGGGTRLTRLVGRTRALDLLSSGRTIRPEEAVEIGLASWIIPTGRDVVEATTEWLQRYTRGRTEVVRAVKNVVVAGTELPVEEALAKEAEQFVNVWGGPAHVEAILKSMKHKK
ncbi:ethylmalonyl-CoA decarboxylase-like [Branchiostoma lanceolatum]|uniref:ethylmalonyl-CoA decarboxylase-like n=1 Tax=Branchiostoma lanceolatum TaxID=7740 RepID=UPI0034557FE2